MAAFLADVGYAAAFSQLLGQTISVVSNARSVRTDVLNKPDLLRQYDSQLDRAFRILTLVGKHQQLQTPDVQEPVEEIRKTVVELDDKVKEGWKGQNIRGAIQYGRELFAAKDDGVKFKAQMNNVDRMLSDLSTIIALKTLELTGALGEGLTRIDECIQDIQQGGLRLAVALENGARTNFGQPAGYTHSSNLETPGIDQDNRVYIRNQAWDEGNVVNSDVGDVIRVGRSTDNRRYEDNSARNKGLVINGSVDTKSFAAILMSRK